MDAVQPTQVEIDGKTYTLTVGDKPINFKEVIGNLEGWKGAENQEEHIKVIISDLVRESKKEGSKYNITIENDNIKISACNLNSFAVDYYNRDENNVNKNYENKALCYAIAAKQEYSYAQNNLGICYYYGEGVDKNLEEAVECYKLAAKQGHASAQNSLGKCYYYGKGVKKNLAEALKYYLSAAVLGRKNAENDFQKLLQNNPNLQITIDKTIYNSENIEGKIDELIEAVKNRSKGDKESFEKLGDNKTKTEAIFEFLKGKIQNKEKPQDQEQSIKEEQNKEEKQNKEEGQNEEQDQNDDKEKEPKQDQEQNQEKPKPQNQGQNQEEPNPQDQGKPNQEQKIKIKLKKANDNSEIEAETVEVGNDNNQNEQFRELFNQKVKEFKECKQHLVEKEENLKKQQEEVSKEQKEKITEIKQKQLTEVRELSKQYITGNKKEQKKENIIVKTITELLNNKPMPQKYKANMFVNELNNYSDEELEKFIQLNGGREITPEGMVALLNLCVDKNAIRLINRLYTFFNKLEETKGLISDEALEILESYNNAFKDLIPSMPCGRNRNEFNKTRKEYLDKIVKLDKANVQLNDVLNKTATRSAMLATGFKGEIGDIEDKLNSATNELREVYIKQQQEVGK